MVSNDGLDGKATNSNCFYLHINFEQKFLKPAIVTAQCTQFLQYLPNVSYVWPMSHISAQCCSRSNLGFLPICFIYRMKNCEQGGKKNCKQACSSIRDFRVMQWKALWNAIIMKQKKKRKETEIVVLVSVGGLCLIPPLSGHYSYWNCNTFKINFDCWK